jgi:ParB family chromosome partitioning protein
MFKLGNINYNNIDIYALKYKISSDNKIDEIIQSIKTFGLLNYPLLLSKSKKYIIVSGFKKIAACRKICFYPNCAMVTDIDNELLCAEVEISENSIQRQLKSVNLIKNVYPDNIKNNSFFEVIAKILQIPFNKIYIQKLLVASKLQNSTLKLVNDGNIAFPVAIDLISFD